MAVNCGVSYGVCRVRLTLVDAAGNVTGSTDNGYVTDAVTSVTVTPNIETGNTNTQRNGCGCKVASFKSPDTFNWFELSFANSKLEPIIDAMLLGGENAASYTIEDGVDVVGVSYPSTLACDADEPAVALEFWTQHVVGSGQDGTYPWVHHVFPKTVWQLGDNTFEDGIAVPTFNGFSRTNTQWGQGPYGDGPPDAQDISEGGWWKTADDPPDADCDYIDVTPAS